MSVRRAGGGREAAWEGEYKPTSSLRAGGHGGSWRLPKKIGPRQDPPPISTASASEPGRRTGNSGVECPKCGDRAKALRTGHDERGRVIRQRRCPNSHEFATIEVPTPYSFYSMVEVTGPPRPSATGKRLFRPRDPKEIEVYLREKGVRAPRVKV